MKKIIAGVCLGLIAAVAPAQQPVSIRIGMSSEDAGAMLGPPTRFYDAGLHAFTQMFPVVYKGPVWECHRRQTKLQEYEVRLQFEADKSISRLHPTLRVSAISILFDRPLKFKEALLDSAEIRRLCAKGCVMQIVHYKGTPGVSYGTDYLRISDEAKTEAVALTYSDDDGTAKPVVSADDPISNIEIESYFSLEKYSEILTVVDAGPISSAQWPPTK